MTDRPGDALGETPGEARVEANMADVAARVGVSIATVSRALRDVPGVNQDTRDRVRRAAAELAYVVSPEASGLAGGDKGRVAVVLPRVDVWFYATMLSNIASRVHAAGLDLLVYQVEDLEQRTAFFRDLPARRKVDAVVLTALPLLAEEVERPDLLGVDVVVAGGRLHDLPHVEVDDRVIAELACRHLLDLGHRRIAMIRTSDTDGAAWSSDVRRVQAWRDTLVAAGIEVDPALLVTEPYGVEAGARAVARLVDLPEPPTAVFAYSDELALSALGELRRRGVRVPDDLSLIGVDGNPAAAVFDLSTVDQDVPTQGRIAAETALALARGESVPESVDVAATLVLRGSTGPPRNLARRGDRT